MAENDINVDPCVLFDQIQPLVNRIQSQMVRMSNSESGGGFERIFKEVDKFDQPWIWKCVSGLRASLFR